MLRENSHMDQDDRDSNENQEEQAKDQMEDPSGQVQTDLPMDELHKVMHLSGMYQDWFLDYASYVILERAVPHVNDGLKPVQRRILHAMKRLDDGRYNKVANIIGHTMQFHPHGDASIGDALVQLGQKELLVDTQGNWGNILTGDGAAAPRYIEARLSKFALEVLFNPKTTEWKPSYDGRNREPITLPVKFPLLLAQGVEGIAVGLASKILPHNFNELIDSAILYLKEQDFELYPDFPTGGQADFSKYNDGIRGGIIKVRAKIDKVDKKNLVITELPYGKTTTSLIESIIKASEKGKIRIKKIDDNTAGNVEIHIQLAPGVSPDKTIDALYAFTDCEVPISPNCCVIDNDKPNFLGVTEVLKRSADNTVELLKRELEIRMAELKADWHFSSLEKIFIEKRIYRDIEECETWESIIETIDKGLGPYKKLLRQEVTHEDIVKLTEIKIKRISKYDSFKADEHIKGIEDEMEEVRNHLANIIPFTINYYKQIRKKFGAGRDRRTEIRNFDTIVATKVAASNQKLFVNRKEGFFGTGLKKDEFVSDCSDIDDIITFRRDGTYQVVKVDEKVFAGKDIMHIAVFKKNDTRTIYNIIYRDGKSGNIMMKRCAITGITRDKEYSISRNNGNSRILYLTANPNGEAEVVKVFLRPKPRLRNTTFEMDFSELAIKGRDAIGNILTKHSVAKITMKEKGVSTLGGRKIWFDEAVLRLNADGRGRFLGEFAGEDKLLVITRSGQFRLSSFSLENHFEDDLHIIEKYKPKKVFSVVYYDGKLKYYYVKRFQFEAIEKLTPFISEHEDSKLIKITEVEYPRFEIKFGGKNKERENEIIEVADFIGVKSFRARGKRLTKYQVELVQELEPVADQVPGDSRQPEEEQPEAIDQTAFVNQQLEERQPAEEKKDASAKSAAKDKPATSDKFAKPDKSAKSDKPATSGKSAKSDKSAKSGKPAKTDKPGMKNKPVSKSKVKKPAPPKSKPEEEKKTKTPAAKKPQPEKKSVKSTGDTTAKKAPVKKSSPVKKRKPGDEPNGQMTLEW